MPGLLPVPEAEATGMRDHMCELLFQHAVAPRTFLLGLRAADLASRARPGQFVMVRVGEATDPLLRRPFSICGLRPPDVLLLLYRVVGHGTDLLSRTPPNTRLAVLGPLGQGFRLPAPGTIPILAAGGIGIAPLIFLAQAVADGGLRLLSGYRSRAEVIELGRVLPLPCAPEIATDDGTAGHHGPVTDLLHAAVRNLPPDRLRLFACWPPAMLRAVARIGRELGSPCQVSLESHMACGFGVCLGCAVPSADVNAGPYWHVCQQGPVFDAAAIDWQALGKNT